MLRDGGGALAWTAVREEDGKIPKYSEGNEERVKRVRAQARGFKWSGAEAVKGALQLERSLVRLRLANQYASLVWTPVQ